MFESFRKSLLEARKCSAARKGMTLIEIMIVVTLMVAIMGLIGWNVIGQADKANDGLAMTQLKSLKSNCEAYRLYYKKFPDKLEDLVNTPDNRKIIDEVPDDPWGNAYNFEKTGNKIKMYSSGSDGLPNTEDDIVVNVG
ncbi:MAG: type II secretion system protein GspG [Proteobacteria bacterium]|jgi:general secretion pathway protein G|nr:type II secretion system protein GspG [Pseudomonadota bacterium]